jgi:hypothetical protein
MTESEYQNCGACGATTDAPLDWVNGRVWVCVKCAPHLFDTQGGD